MDTQSLNYKEQSRKACVKQSVFEAYSSSIPFFFLFVCQLKTKILNHAMFIFCYLEKEIIVMNFLLLDYTCLLLLIVTENAEFLSYVSDFKFAVGLHLWNGIVKSPECNSDPQALYITGSGSDLHRTVNIKSSKYGDLQLDPGNQLHVKFSGV